jgi:hypothetical protein
MKPHEQEWRQEGYRYVERRDSTETVAEVLIGAGFHEDVHGAILHTRFIAAAPDMARALMLALENDRTGHDAPREAIEAALRKAGVL